MSEQLNQLWDIWDIQMNDLLNGRQSALPELKATSAEIRKVERNPSYVSLITKPTERSR